MQLNEQEIEGWFTYFKQVKNGYHMSDWDYTTLISLNHKVMEACHGMHNDNMLSNLKPRTHVVHDNTDITILEQDPDTGKYTIIN